MSGAATMADPVVRPRVDPRFARRWVEVRRQEGKRRLRMMLGAVAVAVVVLVLIGILYSPLLKVRHVRISVGGGPGALTSADVRGLAGLDHYKLMMDVSTAGLVHRLDAVPTLGGARVTRSWPGTVSISVESRAAIAQVAVGGSTTGSGWVTVDATGRVLADVAHQVSALPVLTGLGAPPAPGGWLSGSPGPAVQPGTALAAHVAMDAPADSAAVPRGVTAALAAVQSLPASVRSEIVSVGWSASGDFVISVLPTTMAAGSIPVDLGDGSLLAAKLTSLETLLAKADLAGVVSVNLTDPTRPAALTSTDATTP